MLTSQGDEEQIYSSVSSSLWVLKLPASVDDTAWASSWKRERRAGGVPGEGYPPNWLGLLNMFTGQITPVKLHGGTLEPQGMIFVAS
jgi:hypothetical protein